VPTVPTAGEVHRLSGQGLALSNCASGLSVEGVLNREPPVNTGLRLMSVTKKSNEWAQQLPERTQAAILDFVAYLPATAERQQARREEQAWSRNS